MHIYVHVRIYIHTCYIQTLVGTHPVPLAPWMDTRSEQILTQMASSVCTSQNAERANLFQEWGALEDSRYIRGSIGAD